MASPIASGIPCMNCRKTVSEEDGRVFAEVFVCPGCFLIAERLYQRLELELRRLLAMSKEAIRIALVEGKVSPSSGEKEVLSKEELLKMIVQMSEKKHAR